MRKPKEKEFWITNISRKKDISLSDLRFTVRMGCSYNLLDKRHFHYSEEQLQKSLESGSLFKKRGAIKVRQVAPLKLNTRIDIIEQQGPLRPIRNNVKIEYKHYEELDFDDEKAAEEAFANEDAEAAIQDTAPVLAVDKKYKTSEDE